MLRPSSHCGRCVKPVQPDTTGMSDEQRFTEQLRAQSSRDTPHVVTRTGELYRIPRPPGMDNSDGWSTQCITWPRYHQGVFHHSFKYGPSMLELTSEEQRALQIVCLRTDVRDEKFFTSAAHQKNWKKVGLSRAYFKAGCIRNFFITWENGLRVVPSPSPFPLWEPSFRLSRIFCVSPGM